VDTPNSRHQQDTEPYDVCLEVATTTNDHCSNRPQGTVVTGKVPVAATPSLHCTHSSNGHDTGHRYYMDYQRWAL
jgi:hypothetical protein